MKYRDQGHLNMVMCRIILSGDNVISLHALLRLYFKSFVGLLVLLKSGCIRNSLSNPYKAKQTLEKLNFETLYFFKEKDLLKGATVSFSATPYAGYQIYRFIVAFVEVIALSSCSTVVLF